MNYKIIGNTFPAVTIGMNRGERVVTQSGGMSWMTNDIKMETSTRGGLGKGIKRALAGESVFQTTYTAMADNQSITCASTLPGRIVPVNVGEKEYIAQKGAFLVGQDSVNLDLYTVRNLGGGLFGGEGFFLLKLGGRGTAFLEVEGHLVEKDLAPGEVLKVDTGNIAFFESTVKYDVERIKGAKNMLFGGEGLFNTRVEGPGKVYLQTMSVSELASAISGYIPSSN